jgi:hypothetical protein
MIFKQFTTHVQSLGPLRSGFCILAGNQKDPKWSILYRYSVLYYYGCMDVLDHQYQIII